MRYLPLNYQQLNLSAGTNSPSTIKSYNNRSFAYWERSLFQRACSTLIFDLPENWQGSTRDFFYYCLFRFGFVAVFDTEKFGFSFQPCTLSGYDFYYQPIDAVVSNPLFTNTMEIGKECELIKLTPDYMGIWDVIEYYADRLSTLDNAINISLVNNKFAFMIGARNKTAGEALKKMLDKVNRGEPAVIYDMKLLNDPTDKAEPWQLMERKDLKGTYLTTDQLQDWATILSQFDAEIGIPTVPYQKKERMVTSEAESRQIDATSRNVVWFDTLTSSIDKVNRLFGSDLKVSLRYPLEQEDDQEEGVTDER